MLHENLKIMCILQLFDGVFYKCQLYQFYLCRTVFSSIFDDFLSTFKSITERYWIIYKWGFLHLSFYCYQFFLMNFDALFWCGYTFWMLCFLNYYAIKPIYSRQYSLLWISLSLKLINKVIFKEKKKTVLKC